MLPYCPSTCIKRLRLTNWFVHLKPFSSPAYSVHSNFNPLILTLLTDQIQTDVYLFHAFLISLGPFPQQPPRQLPQLGLERTLCLLQVLFCLRLRKELVLKNPYCISYQSWLSLSCLSEKTSHWVLLSSSRTHSHKLPSLV